MLYNICVNVISYMNDTQTKIEKSARIADIVLKIARILGWILIGMLVLLIGAVVVIYGIAGPEAFNEWILSDGSSFPEIFAVFSIESLAYMGFIMGILIVAGKIFSDIRKTLLPFTKDNAQHLKTIALLIALISVIPGLIEMIGAAIIGVSMEMFTISIEGLVLAFVVYSLAHIFEYGLELQEQADETL